jgi:putative FmdB family regulatory protein
MSASTHGDTEGERVPTYQYVCNDCGESLEAVQKFSDDALTVCPSCEGKLRKVYSAVGVVFKGSGFYRNDSRSTTSSSTPAAGKSETSAPATSGSAGSDSSGSGSTPATAAPAPSTPSTPASGKKSGDSKVA